MKKLFVLISLLAFMFSLGACAKELSKEEVFTKLDENAEKVESYNTNVNLNVEIIDLEDDKTVQESSSTLNVDMIEPTLQSSGTITSTQADKKSITQYYATDDGTYVNVNGTGWKDASENKSQFQNDDTLYMKVQELVQGLKNDVKMELKNDQYVLTFNGKSKHVLEAFEGPYSVQLTGLSKDEVEQDVVIKINKDTFFIEHVENVLQGEKNGHKLILSIEQEYSTINEIDSIDIPKNVIDKAL